MYKSGHNTSSGPSCLPFYLTHARMANVSSTLRIRTKAGIRKQTQMVRGALAKADTGLALMPHTTRKGNPPSKSLFSLAS